MKLLLLTALVVAACSGPGQEAGSVDGYTWRELEGPDGQECIVLERSSGSQLAVLALDCRWGNISDTQE